MGLVESRTKDRGYQASDHRGDVDDKAPLFITAHGALLPDTFRIPENVLLYLSSSKGFYNFTAPRALVDNLSLNGVDPETRVRLMEADQDGTLYIGKQRYVRLNPGAQINDMELEYSDPEFTRLFYVENSGVPNDVVVVTPGRLGPNDWVEVPCAIMLATVLQGALSKSPPPPATTAFQRSVARNWIERVAPAANELMRALQKASQKAQPEKDFIFVYSYQGDYEEEMRAHVERCEEFQEKVNDFVEEQKRAAAIDLVRLWGFWKDLQQKLNQEYRPKFPVVKVHSSDPLLPVLHSQELEDAYLSVVFGSRSFTLIYEDRGRVVDMDHDQKSTLSAELVRIGALDPGRLFVVVCSSCQGGNDYSLSVLLSPRKNVVPIANTEPAIGFARDPGFDIVHFVETSDFIPREFRLDVALPWSRPSLRTNMPILPVGRMADIKKMLVRSADEALLRVREQYDLLALSSTELLSTKKHVLRAMRDAYLEQYDHRFDDMTFDLLILHLLQQPDYSRNLSLYLQKEEKDHGGVLALLRLYATRIFVHVQLLGYSPEEALLGIDADADASHREVKDTFLAGFLDIMYTDANGELYGFRLDEYSFNGKISEVLAWYMAVKFGGTAPLRL